MANPGNVTYSTAGTYTVSFTVTDSGGAKSQPATRTVTVADFSLSATPASGSILAGASTTYTATVTAGPGFTGTVTFSVTGLPAGATASFNPTSVNTSGSTTLSVTTNGSTSAGSYPLTITGTSGPVTQSVNVTMVITGDFTISGKLHDQKRRNCHLHSDHHHCWRIHRDSDALPRRRATAIQCEFNTVIGREFEKLDAHDRSQTQCAGGGQCCDDHRNQRRPVTLDNRQSCCAIAYAYLS